MSLSDYLSYFSLNREWSFYIFSDTTSYVGIKICAESGNFPSAYDAASSAQAG